MRASACVSVGRAKKRDGLEKQTNNRSAARCLGTFQQPPPNRSEGQAPLGPSFVALCDTSYLISSHCSHTACDAATGTECLCVCVCVNACTRPMVPFLVGA